MTTEPRLNPDGSLSWDLLIAADLPEAERERIREAFRREFATSSWEERGLVTLPVDES